jgi:hypothetical protein
VGYLRCIGKNEERSVIAEQIVALSVNVLRKHRWVDLGWVFAGIALICLVGFGLTYVF